MNGAQFELNCAERKVVFHGDCAEMRATCKAMCCREWVVTVTAEEYASSRYDADIACVLTDRDCRTPARPCRNRQYRLKKREDMSCIYLEDNRCHIYEERPRTCRDFQCTDGWRLAHIVPKAAVPGGREPRILNQENFIRRLCDESVFVLHPLIKLLTVFNLKPKQEIVFVKEMVGSCGKFSTYGHFYHPQLDDARLLKLIDMFNRKESLGEIHRNFCSECQVQLSRTELYEIVWLLNKNNIILDILNFKGMLSGMGGIG
jgi:hypothetical protein